MTDAAPDPALIEAIARLEADERAPVFDAFGHDDAWTIGVWLRERAVAEGHPVAIDIRRPSGAVLFHVGLPGATADQEEWIRRKVAVVVRFESSSALFAARLQRADVDPHAMGWLAADTYALAGGAVPIRVAGAGIVAVLTISGLSSEEDHALAVAALHAHARPSGAAGTDG